jgi:hypothetical protein
VLGGQCFVLALFFKDLNIWGVGMKKITLIFSCLSLCFVLRNVFAMDKQYVWLNMAASTDEEIEEKVDYKQAFKILAEIIGKILVEGKKGLPLFRQYVLSQNINETDFNKIQQAFGKKNTVKKYAEQTGRFVLTLDLDEEFLLIKI